MGRKRWQTWNNRFVVVPRDEHDVELIIHHVSPVHETLTYSTISSAEARLTKTHRDCEFATPRTDTGDVRVDDGFHLRAVQHRS